MNSQQVVQALLLITQLSAQLPTLIDAVRATLSADDEAVLKAELEKLREANVAAYDGAIAALRRAQS